ncbi:hypothetical protein [Frankia sp. QA3]|uniref:hypothetical protein n=1 Tax=Frankia sp. QA3 TaxID=710111 RepID=UPI0012FA49E5|nr:hypothetical protein [Frankia sp. QA3]
MLVRTDPFREAERLTQHLLGRPGLGGARPVPRQRHGQDEQRAGAGSDSIDRGWPGLSGEATTGKARRPGGVS